MVANRAKSGQEILIKTRIGVVSAYYYPGEGWTETYEGRDFEGPEWVCSDDKFTVDEDEVLGWIPLPE